MINLRQIVTKRITPTYKLNKCYCNTHSYRNRYCQVIIKKNENKFNKIYGKDFNYMSNEYLVHCSERPKEVTNLFKITANKFEFEDPMENYLKIDGMNILRIGTMYICMDLLIFLNQITVNGKEKMIGVLTIFFTIFLPIFFTI